jgi:hypothetical protein
MTMRPASTDSMTPSFGHDRHAGVRGNDALDARAYQRRRGPQKRHGLPLHVRAHERAVGVVVLEERDERRRDDTSWFGLTSMSVTFSRGTIWNSPCSASDKLLSEVGRPASSWRSPARCCGSLPRAPL